MSGQTVLLRQITINVTEDDIQNGVKNSPWDCPYALAITRALQESGYVLQAPHSRPVGVCSSDVRISLDDQEDLYCKIPSSEAGSIRDYDAGRPIDPSTFVLNLDDRSS